MNFVLMSGGSFALVATSTAVLWAAGLAVAYMGTSALTGNFGKDAKDEDAALRGVGGAQELPQAPKAIDAEAEAKAEIKRKRMIRARTGGKTILSSGDTGAEKKTLLGE